MNADEVNKTRIKELEWKISGLEVDNASLRKYNESLRNRNIILGKGMDNIRTAFFNFQEEDKTYHQRYAIKQPKKETADAGMQIGDIVLPSSDKQVEHIWKLNKQQEEHIRKLNKQIDELAQKNIKMWTEKVIFDGKMFAWKEQDKKIKEILNGSKNARELGEQINTGIIPTFNNSKPNYDRDLFNRDGDYIFTETNSGMIFYREKDEYYKNQKRINKDIDEILHSFSRSLQMDGGYLRRNVADLKKKIIKLQWKLSKSKKEFEILKRRALINGEIYFGPLKDLANKENEDNNHKKCN